MSILTNRLHPTFDALSAYADLSDIDATRARVGRHLARCATCAAAVAEIRALGDAARCVELPGAPSRLWHAIEQGVQQPSAPISRPTPSPDDDQVWRPAPSLRPTIHTPSPVRRRVVRVSAGLLAAAAIVLTVLIAAPGPSPLFASSAGRITFLPFRPAPGSRVRVRYRPAPKMAKFDRLVLVGSYANSSDQRRPDYYFGRPFDSLATLHRTPDGAMAGEFIVPADFRAVALVLEDPSGLTHDGDGLSSWILVGGDAHGRPALASLLAAGTFSSFPGSRSAAGILDTLQRYFPDHPAGYATARRYDGHGVFSDLLEYFKGAERKYAAFDERLERLPRVDADRTVAMITFANAIEEPGEAAKWTRRFVREHPDDPRALELNAMMLHEMLNRGLPPDSIRRLLPTLDSIASRAPNSARIDGYDQDLVDRYGDAAMQRRWALRAALGGRLPGILGVGSVDARWLTDPEIRQAAMATLRRGTTRDCGRTKGHHVARQPFFNWRSDCDFGRQLSFAALSRIVLLDGRPIEARDLADSSVAMMLASGSCQFRAGYRALGSARLATGDTAGAAEAFASAFASPDERSAIARDSIRRIVSPVVDSARFAALSARAQNDAAACARTWRDRAKAEKEANQ